MTEMVTSGSMSGERKRSDGLLGESDHERRRLHQAPPVLHATALLLDSTVILAAHGQDAIQRLRHRCPDLIVLDLNMPVMDGWTFRTEQRDLADQKRAAVPVLLMTGEENASAFAETLQAVG